MLTYQIIGAIRRALGCGPAVAGDVFRMREERRWTAAARHPEAAGRLERLAWRAFRDYRRECLEVGLEDPAWELLAPSPVGTAGLAGEGGGS